MKPINVSQLNVIYLRNKYFQSIVILNSLHYKREEGYQMYNITITICIQNYMYITLYSSCKLQSVACFSSTIKMYENERPISMIALRHNG